MAHTYTPGLTVSARTTHRTRRLLPIAGDVLVEAGQQIAARDIVAQTFLPGSVTPVNVANLLSLPPGDVPECMLKQQGETVELGEPLARTKGIFGFFKAECKSKAVGTIESISEVTGQVIIRGEPEPIQVDAYIQGAVAEVIPNEGVVVESDVSFVQGIFGIGGEAFGAIKLACESHRDELIEARITSDMRGAVVIGGARVTGAAVKKAIEYGVAAIVSGGMDDQDLREILGYDLGVAITGSETVGITLIITEGFGEIAMAERTYQLFTSREGAEASVNGATQIRAGVMRPEILIPVDPNAAAEKHDQHEPGALEIGSTVRVIREPHFGHIGNVAELPAEPQQLESESKARVLSVTFENSETAVVPRANVELIEG